MKESAWDTAGLIEQINEIRFGGRDGSAGFDPENREALFEKALELLQLVQSRRVAVMLADKVTGHQLPVELVEMVRDYICGDKSLTGSNEEHLDNDDDHEHAEPKKPTLKISP